MGRGKKLRLAERRRQRALLKMTVVSAGVDSSDTVSMATEVKHCNAALLYADEVTLVSPRAALLKSAAEAGSLSGMDMVRFMITVGPSIAPDTSEFINLVNILINIPQFALFTPELQAQHQELIDSLIVEMTPLQEKLEENARNLLARSGYDKLSAAIDLGVLSIDDMDGFEISNFDDQSDPMAVGLLTKIQEVLSSGNQYPLFDAQINGLVRSGVEAGIFTPVSMSRRLGSDAAMASGLFDRLPNFPNASTDEILDIRQVLGAPLQRFRSGVRELTLGLDVTYESEQFANEIEDAWNLRVAPALTEIEETMMENSSLRDLMGRMIRDGGSVPALSAAAAGTATSLAVAAGPLTTLPLATATAVGLTVAAVRSFMGQGEALREAKGTQFYFLYGTNDYLRNQSG